MNSNWPFWIKLSLARYFDANKSSLGFNYEGDTKEVDESTDRFELRIDGPDSECINKDSTLLTLTVDCLVVTIDDPVDIFKHEKNVGIVQALFTNNIGVKNSSNQSVGCLRLISKVMVTDYGKVRAGLQAKHSTLTAQYEAYWEN